MSYPAVNNLPWEAFPITELPSEIVSYIMSFLSYDQVAQLRLVCKFFDACGRARLNSGFFKTKDVIKKMKKRLLLEMPRRESQRTKHPLKRYVNVLHDLDMRLTGTLAYFPHYIKEKLCCFFPGKVLDEIWIWIQRVRERRVQNEFYFDEMIEVDDLATMASEFFRDVIEPDLKRRLVTMEKERWTKYYKLQSDNAALTAKTVRLEKAIQDKTLENSRLEELVKDREEDRKKISRLEEQLEEQLKEQAKLLNQLSDRRKRKSETDDSSESPKKRELDHREDDLAADDDVEDKNDTN